LVPDADTVIHTIDGGWALVQLNVCLTFKSDCHSRTAPYATTDGGASWSALSPG
jgi:hypothetical protein